MTPETARAKTKGPSSKNSDTRAPAAWTSRVKTCWIVLDDGEARWDMLGPAGRSRACPPAAAAIIRPIGRKRNLGARSRHAWIGFAGRSIAMLRVTKSVRLPLVGDGRGDSQDHQG